MISLRILEHLEGGADQLLGEVHSGSFHKIQAVLVHDDAHSSLLKHSENRVTIRSTMMPVKQELHSVVAIKEELVIHYFELVQKQHLSRQLSNSGHLILSCLALFLGTNSLLFAEAQNEFDQRKSVRFLHIFCLVTVMRKNIYALEISITKA